VIQDGWNNDLGFKIHLLEAPEFFYRNIRSFYPKLIKRKEHIFEGKFQRLMRILISIIIGFSMFCIQLFSWKNTAHAQVPAFPGAEGGGLYTTGGRGGQVIYVENLNDKGPGSLRKAIEAKGPRTIVFKVSGNIELAKPIYIKNGDVTIAGQSAPGDGICLKNYGVEVEADNVIIRFIRVRPGQESGEELDAISGMNQKNIIIDHCSFSWGTDEAASFYENTDFTLQWCIVSESLDQSVHSKGNHGYGGIWGGKNASFHHNLITDHSSRNPRFHGSRYNNDPDTEQVDFRNNVIYNWGYNSVYGGEEGFYNMVNNYYKPGPATKKDVRYRILDLTQSFFNPTYNKDTLGAGKFFIEGNVVEGFPEATNNNWRKGVQGKGVDEKKKLFSRLNEPVPHSSVATETAIEAFKRVLQSAGSSLRRDAADERIVEEARTGKEQYGSTFSGGRKGIIDSPEDVGGWPLLKQIELPVDSDMDGMPDSWEKTNMLNPNDPADANAFTLNTKYTNLEVYLNSLVEHLMR
jgi:pectate lyase